MHNSNTGHTQGLLSGRMYVDQYQNHQALKILHAWLDQKMKNKRLSAMLMHHIFPDLPKQVFHEA